MIIWGTRGRERILSSGQFHCPKCDKRSPYQHKRVARYFTLFFIPIFPIQTLGEHIVCKTCNQSYKPEVLNYKPPSKSERLLIVARNDLDSGTPIQMVYRKLVNSGMDEDTAKKTVAAAAGEVLRTCQDCGLTYREPVARCSECGKVLTTQIENRTYFDRSIERS